MGHEPTGITAECPVCGVAFFKSSHDTLDASDILTCEGCGLKLSYGFLQSRIPKAQEQSEQKDEGGGSPKPRKRKAAKRRKRSG